MAHRLAVSTVSLGWHPSHTLERKIGAAQKAGFQGIELFITDLDAFAERHQISRMEAAKSVCELCTAANLHIVCLASFDNYEGEPTPLNDRLAKAIEWLDLANALGTDIIQIPSNDSKNAFGEVERMVEELQVLADLSSKGCPPVSLAYEALGWGTHVADWEESLRIVLAVDRPNFRLCLDSYHVLARLWADPRAQSGLRPGGAAALRASIQRFLDHCPKDKIAYIQLSDAERMVPPILPGHAAFHDGRDGIHSWCTYGRLFPLETDKGAYLPIEEIAKAWLAQSGWSGWVSLEVFHRTMKTRECRTRALG